MQVVKHSVIYLGSSIINKITPFLLLPVLTKYLSTEEYGILMIFQLLITLYTAFIGMGVNTNVSKNFTSYSHQQISKLVGNILFILSILTLLFLMMTFLLTLFYNEIFSIPASLIQSIPLLSFMFMVNTINLTILRNEGKAYTYGMFEISNTSVNIFVTILFLVVYHYGWQSRVIGIVIAYFIFFISSMIYMKKRAYLSFDINKKEIISILELSIPLIPHMLSGLVITLSDRIFIEHMISLEMVGIYSVGYTFGMVIMIVTDAFIKAWNPWFYASLKDLTIERKEKIVKYTYIYIIGIFILTFLLVIVFKHLLPYIVDGKFYGAEVFIVWIALGYAVHGVYKIFFPYLVYVNKTTFIALSTSIAAILNLIFNYIFILNYGAIGAAYATIVAYIVSSALVIWYHKNYYDMPWFNFEKIFHR